VVNHPAGEVGDGGVDFVFSVCIHIGFGGDVKDEIMVFVASQREGVPINHMLSLLPKLEAGN